MKNKKQITKSVKFIQSPVPFGNGKKIGIYVDEHEKIWFHGPDVARMLEYSHSSDMYRMIDDDNKGAHNVQGVNNGAIQSCVSISEAGFYQVALSSRTELGKKLFKFVCEELLPSVRKNGTYISENASPEQIKFSLENSIIDSVIASVKGETKRTGKLIKQLLDTKPLDTIRTESMPYMADVLTRKKIAGSKDKMFECLASNIANWGNDRWKEKKLDMTNQYIIMSLLRDCEEKYNVYLKTSRAQSKRQANTKIAKLKYSEMNSTNSSFSDDEIF